MSSESPGKSRFTVLLILLLSSITVAVKITKTLQPIQLNTTFTTQKDNITFVHLNEKDSQNMKNKWHEQAISGLMAAIAMKNAKYLSDREKETMEQCSQNAKTLDVHANCILPAIAVSRQRRLYKNEPPIRQKKPPPRKNARPLATSKRFEKYRSKIINQSATKQMDKIFERGSKKPFLGAKNKEKLFATAKRVKFNSGAFQRKNRSFEMVHGARKNTFFGHFADMFMKEVLKAKNKTSFEPWQRIIADARIIDSRRKMERNQRSRFKKFMQDNGDMDIRQIEALMDSLASDSVDTGNINKAKLLKEFKSPNSKISGNKSAVVKNFLLLLREGIKLAYMFNSQNTTDFDSKTIRLLSPKFFSIFPTNSEDSDNQLDILSPSILSLQSNGTNKLEQSLSLPNLISTFSTTDQQKWLDFIFEATDIQKSISQADIFPAEAQLKRKKRYEEEMRGPDGQKLYLTKEDAIRVLGPGYGKHIDVFERLATTYSLQQATAINETGFAILSKQQLRMFYGPKSPYADSAVLKKLLALKDDEILHRIEDDIAMLARPKKYKRDIVMSIMKNFHVTNDPPMLSQLYLLSPMLQGMVVGSAAVLGPIILSPVCMVPIIMSPRVLSPTILDPIAMAPMILTPFVLHPFILCPGVFNPFILSPFVIAPFILSPQAFSPIVLSPFLFSPFIFTPHVGTPLIVSPFVLTPIVFSNLALFAVILSPNALSPLIESKLFYSEVILSPSWLS